MPENGSIGVARIGTASFVGSPVIDEDRIYMPGWPHPLLASGRPHGKDRNGELKCFSQTKGAS
jgi:hypothetical protein